MKKRFKVYVGCSLTHAPEEFKLAVEELKLKLEKICKVLKFKGITDDSPFEVYFHDICNCVYQCDLLVAICDHPSTGLGWEMATQTEARGKALLAVAHNKSKISKLIQDPRLPGYEFQRYENLADDVYNMVLEKLKTL